MATPSSIDSSQTIRDLSRNHGVSFVYITHRLKELYEICDEVTVMRDGQVVSSSLSTEITTSDLIRQMVGRELTDLFPETV